MRAVAVVVCCAAGCGDPEHAGETTGDATAMTDAPTTKAASTGDAESTDEPTTNAATSTSTSSSSDATTDSSGRGSSGEPSDPAVEFELVTANNRAYVEMHGGWGPHLRAPMQASDGSLWFAFDGGPDVNTNATIRYARRGDDGWEEVATQPHAAGVQQNSAHVLRDDFVMTYSVNIATSVLEECYLDTTDTSYAACNTIAIGGAYSTPLYSNYVGAALGPAGETIVWFTVVGDAGGTGQFVYTHDYGGGWNGPTVAALPGYNDYAYVRASFRGPSHVAVIGQAYVGDHPDGEYALGVDEIMFGQPAAFETLGPAAVEGEVRTGMDVWIDPSTGDAHALARVGNDLAYYFVPTGEAWGDHLDPAGMIEGGLQARWLHEDGGPLAVIVSTTTGLEARWADAGASIDWSTASVLDIVAPAEGLEQPTAIYAASPVYQTVPVAGLNFALCGAYQVADTQIWHGTLTL